MTGKMLTSLVASVALALMPALAIAQDGQAEKGDITRTGTGTAVNLAQTPAPVGEDEGIAAGAIAGGGLLLLGGAAALAFGGGGGGGPGVTGTTTAPITTTP